MTAEETAEAKPPRSPMYGKPWKVSSRHMNFADADKARTKIAADALSVKVQRMSDDTFVVKTRANTEAVPDDKQPRTKGKPRTKSEKRKLRAEKQKRKADKS